MLRRQESHPRERTDETRTAMRIVAAVVLWVAAVLSWLFGLVLFAVVLAACGVVDAVTYAARALRGAVR